MTETQALTRREPLPPKLTDDAIDALVENITPFEKFKQKALSTRDFTQMGDNQYIEKSGWVKLAMALNVSFRLVSDLTKVTSHDEEGEYYLWHVRGEATTPGGRVIQMDGSCTSRDEFFSISNGQRRKTSEIDEKDILATAETNAFNRCMAFLCGFGELSGEEMRGKQFARKAVTFPFGPKSMEHIKGKTPMDLDAASLHKLLPMFEALAADPKNKFAEANMRLVTAIKETIAEKTAPTESGGAAPEPRSGAPEPITSQEPLPPDTPPVEPLPQPSEWDKRFASTTTIEDWAKVACDAAKRRAEYMAVDGHMWTEIKRSQDRNRVRILEATPKGEQTRSEVLGMHARQCALARLADSPGRTHGVYDERSGHLTLHWRDGDRSQPASTDARLYTRFAATRRRC